MISPADFPTQHRESWENRGNRPTHSRLWRRHPSSVDRSQAVDSGVHREVPWFFLGRGWDNLKHNYINFMFSLGMFPRDEVPFVTHEIRSCLGCSMGFPAYMGAKSKVGPNQMNDWTPYFTNTAKMRIKYWPKEHEGVQCPMKKCKCHYQMGSVSKKNNNLIIESSYSNPGQDGNCASRIKMMFFLFPMFSRFPTVRHRFEGCYTPAGRSWEFTTYYTNTGGTWTSLGRFFFGIMMDFAQLTSKNQYMGYPSGFCWPDPGSWVSCFGLFSYSGTTKNRHSKGVNDGFAIYYLCHMDLFGSPDWGIAWIDLEMVRPGLTHRMMWWLKASQFLWRGQQHVWK